MTNSTAGNRWVAGLSKNLPPALPDFLRQRRWFGAKARVIQAIEVWDVIPLLSDSPPVYLFLIRIAYVAGPRDMYALPLAVGSPEQSSRDEPAVPSLKVLSDSSSSPEIVLYDALSSPRFLQFLLEAIDRGDYFTGVRGEVTAVSAGRLHHLWEPLKGPPAASLMKAEQSNSSVVYGDRLVLKLFRHLEEGVNPDLELGSFLTQAGFRNVPPLEGHLDYASGDGKHITLGLLQGYVPNQGDAWRHALTVLDGFYEQARSHAWPQPGELPRAPILSLADQGIPHQAIERIGPYVEWARLLGIRTAELHLALSSAPLEPAFAPEPFTEQNRRELVSSAELQLASTCQLMHQQSERLPEPIRQEVLRLLTGEDSLRQRFQSLEEFRFSAMRIRIHGDYHLGQILFTGEDFIIIDFEGEPAQPLSERRSKRLPLQDVAGMLRSFHYAAYAPLLGEGSAGENRAETLRTRESWAQYWQLWVSVIFLKTYLDRVGSAPFIPESREELTVLLDVHILNKAIYELGYELNHRPSWLGVPLRGISNLLEHAA